MKKLYFEFVKDIYPASVNTLKIEFRQLLRPLVVTTGRERLIRTWLIRSST